MPTRNKNNSPRLPISRDIKQPLLPLPEFSLSLSPNSTNSTTHPTSQTQQRIRSREKIRKRRPRIDKVPRNIGFSPLIGLYFSNAVIPAESSVFALGFPSALGILLLAAPFTSGPYGIGTSRYVVPSALLAFTVEHFL